ncbi:MAG: trimethylamine methyltransferase family protein, partial [Gammaproteobacteria bacterium]|nr:trimethylamine methyltransferase family protein [Gammaproteobacteria bacterium]
MGEVRTKRMGGRAGRKALRAAPRTDEDKAVLPGMLGGRYKPLSDADIERIHRAALDVLEQIGLCDAIPSCIDLVTAGGGTYTDEGRLLFPRSLVEDTLAMAARNFVLHGQAPGREMELAGYKVYFGTAGAAVHIVDVETREYRDSTLADLYDIARLVDSLEH